MNIAEILGLAATCVILLSLFQTSTVRLRVINTVGSVMMVIYGMWISAISVWILNTACVVINLYRLHQHRTNLGKLKGGCIIVGYQGIGKSTSASRHLDYIDLESSTTKINGVRNDNWFVPYCESAYNLAKQGYVVFVSSHAVVREYFENTHEARGVNVYACFPSKRLKLEWIKKLRKRYEHTHLEKDRIAWKNASEMYDENIEALQLSPLPSIILKRMQYDLDSCIEEVRNLNS